MPPNVIDVVIPQTEPIPEIINAVNSRKHHETNEYPIAENQKNSKINETPRKSKNNKIGPFEFETELIWPNIIGITLLHIGSVYTIFTFGWLQYWPLTIWAVTVGVVSGLGVTGGAHRYWTHRSYKAKLPLQVILIFKYLVAGQNSIVSWVRDHRVHHKFSETDADPHNSNRGFFFSHVGWLMMKKHPEVLRRGKQIDMSDILDDPLLQFVEKHFTILKLIACFVLPTFIPIYFWNQEWYSTILSQVVIRYTLALNAAFSVNSLAHFWGGHSYDGSIRPAENRLVGFMTNGEGWHNYHHTFPWDYKAAELGNYTLNGTTMMIDAFAKIGWAYDLKRASDDLIQKVAENKGDGTHPVWGKHDK